MAVEPLIWRIERRIRSSPGITSYELKHEFGNDAWFRLGDLYEEGIIRKWFDPGYRTPRGRRGGWRYIHVATPRSRVPHGECYLSEYGRRCGP